MPCAQVPKDKSIKSNIDLIRDVFSLFSACNPLRPNPKAPNPNYHSPIPSTVVRTYDSWLSRHFAGIRNPKLAENIEKAEVEEEEDDVYCLQLKALCEQYELLYITVTHSVAYSIYH